MPESAIFSFFIGHIFQNILHPAVQDLAERIQRGGRHGLSVLHAVEKAGIYTLLEDQVVFSYALSKERLIKRLIADHLIHRVKINILDILTILHICCTMKPWTIRRLAACPNRVQF